MNNWKTTLLGILTIALTLLQAIKLSLTGAPVNWQELAAQFAIGWGLIHAADAKKIVPLLLICFAVFASGCTHMASHQTRTYTPEGKILSETTRTAVTSFYDAKNELNKFKTTQSQNAQGISIGSLSQETSGTNALAALDKLARIAEAVGK